jgi:hypothetical protein
MQESFCSCHSCSVPMVSTMVIASCMDPQPVWTLRKDRNVLPVIGNKLEFPSSRNEKHCDVKTLSVFSVSSDPFWSKPAMLYISEKRKTLCCLMKCNELSLYICNFHYYRCAVSLSNTDSHFLFHLFSFICILKIITNDIGHVIYWILPTM